MSDVVITGVTGFIGSHLAKALVDKGFKVYGIVRHAATRDLKPLEGYLDEMIFLTADLRDYASVRHALRSANPDYVCHLGALTPVRYSFEHPFEHLEVNSRGTINVVHAILELPDFRMRRLIAASTAEVYGWQKEEKPFTEDLPLRPASPYAISKAAADLYIQMASKVYGLNSIVLRPSNSYGRKFETGFIVEYVVTGLLKKEKIYIGTPDSVRDYLYVDDHVNAYVAVIEHSGDVSGEVFNVSTGTSTKVRELVKKIARIVGCKGEVVYGSYPPGYPQRPGFVDPSYLVLDYKKIKQALNWQPKNTLDEGLRKTVNFWNEKLVKKL